jgi:hypothetical protein
MNTIKHKWYTIELCRKNPDSVFIFGDNLVGRGCGGQAQIRFEPNAYGIPTKKFPSMSEDSFFSDNEFEENIKHISDALNNIPTQFSTIVFPEDGLGTGLAELPKRAPRTYKWLVNEIDKRFGEVCEK